MDEATAALFPDGFEESELGAVPRGWRVAPVGEVVDTVGGGLQRLLARAERGQNIAVFTSGGTITALLHLLTGVPAERAFELNWQIVNTSLSRLTFRGDEATLASFNSRVHLELLKTPELITYR